jgi:hypothetical protein
MYWQPFNGWYIVPSENCFILHPSFTYRSEQNGCKLSCIDAINHVSKCGQLKGGLRSSHTTDGRE